MAELCARAGDAMFRHVPIFRFVIRLVQEWFHTGNANMSRLPRAYLAPYPSLLSLGLESAIQSKLKHRQHFNERFTKGLTGKIFGRQTRILGR